MDNESREYVINRLINCVIPSRFATYPIKWYHKLSDAQLIRMCEEIVVDGPTIEDYVEDETEEKLTKIELTDDERELLSLQEKYPTFPYRFNPETNDLEVYTESKKFEVVYD